MNNSSHTPLGGMSMGGYTAAGPGSGTGTGQYAMSNGGGGDLHDGMGNGSAGASNAMGGVGVGLGLGVGSSGMNQAQAQSPLDMLMSAIAASGIRTGTPGMHQQTTPHANGNGGGTGAALGGHDLFTGGSGYQGQGQFNSPNPGNSNTSIPSPLPPHIQLALLSNILAGHNIPQTDISMGDGSGVNTDNNGNMDGYNAYYPPPTPQQTRSGRISRPPQHHMPYYSHPGSVHDGQGQGPAQWQTQTHVHGSGQGQGQTENPGDVLFRAIQMLQQPGMETIRQALLGGDISVTNGGQGQGQSSSRTQHANNMVYPEITYNGVVSQQITHPPKDTTNSSESNLDAHTQPRKRRRTNTKGSNMNSDGVDNQSRDRTPASSPPPEVPAWPQPMRGKGSRLALTKDEILDRRKARNKKSALQSRARKQERVEMLEDELRVKEEAMREVELRCEGLEREVESLRRYITSAGIRIPSGNTPHPVNGSTSTPIVGQMPFAQAPLQQTLQVGIHPQSQPHPQVHRLHIPTPTAAPSSGLSIPSAPAIATPYDTPATFDSTSEPLLDFNLFMNLDGLDDDDDDFMPETSPHHLSDSEGEGDGSDDDEDTDGEEGGQREDGEDGEDTETTPRASTARVRTRGKNGKKGKGKKNGKKKGKRSGDGNDRRENENDDDFVDPEMEDEDLFLPIEDVPIPPNEVWAWANGGFAAGGVGGGGVSGIGIGGGGGLSSEIGNTSTNSNGVARAGSEASSTAYLPAQAPHVPHVNQTHAPPIGQIPHDLNDLTQDMMKALRVDTRDQLAAVMRKLVDSAGEGGVSVAPDVMDKLKSVMYLAQAGEKGEKGEGEG